MNVVACHDNQLELWQMAQWAHQQLLNGQQFVGCVLPDLNQQRTTVMRIFSQVIPDENLFNISAGQSFIAFPVIHQAFNLLQLGQQQQFSLSIVSQVLRSPYTGDAEREKATRALLDAKLHQHGELVITKTRLIQWSRHLAPLFHQRLIKCSALSEINTGSPSEWSAYFSSYLATVGWPGEHSLNSPEYQVVQRWLELLSEFATIDCVMSSITLSQALSYLRQLASDTQFQTQTSDAPIQILGVLEAAGITFDALWISGLNDENWPAAAKPNPFIPLPLQRQFNMPHASASRELTFSRQLTERLVKSAPRVLLSYALNDEDRPLRPSPLINKYPSMTSETLGLKNVSTMAQQLFASSDLEVLEDMHAPAVTKEEIIKGGSFILKSQAACPFQAFAAIRLNATTIAEPHLGLNALQRGVILHRILEMVWQQIKSHQQLCEMTPTELNQLIENSVTETLFEFQKIYPHHLSPRFRLLEQQRLGDLLRAWLEIEKQRPPFTVISQEIEQQIHLANLSFSLRADRIDQLASGEKILIDYKSAKTNINDWFGDRLAEPQLPLYSLCDEEIAALVFAQVRIDDMGFKGLSDSVTGIPGVTAFSEIADAAIADSWQTQRQLWHQQLNSLAEDFAAGYAAVDPKDRQQTCARCELKGLCRIS